MKPADDNDRLREGKLGKDPFEGAEHLVGADWPEPIPFGSHTSPPPFPVHVLPDWIKRFATEASEALQCPIDVPATLGLCAVSLAIAKKLDLCIRPGWREPLNLYAVLALRSGESKSPAFRVAVAPLQEFERRENAKRAPEIARRVAELDFERETLANFKREGARKNGDDAKAYRSEFTSKSEALDASMVPSLLRLIADDTTPDALARTMIEQGGRIGLFSPEGELFEILSGRYAEGKANFGLVLLGYSGDPYRCDRIGRVGGSIRAPSITLALTVQPYVVQGLQDRPGFRGKGLLARCLFVLPESRVGSRRADPEPMSSEANTQYDAALCNLLALPERRDALDEIESDPIDVAPDALAPFFAFKAEIEATLGPAGSREAIEDWCNKLPGSVARLAGVLHCADRAFEPDRILAEPLDILTMQRAIELGRYYLAHAERAFDLMGADPLHEKARWILRWIVRHKRHSFTVRELFRDAQARFKRVADLDPCLALLVEHGYVRLRAEAPTVKKGRKASPTYDANPRWMLTELTKHESPKPNESGE